MSAMAHMGVPQKRRGPNTNPNGRALMNKAPTKGSPNLYKQPYGKRGSLLEKDSPESKSKPTCWHGGTLNKVLMGCAATLARRCQHSSSSGCETLLKRSVFLGWQATDALGYAGGSSKC